MEGKAGATSTDRKSLFSGQGPVLAMAFLRPGGCGGGQYVGHAEVENIAGLENIQLRTGCFCNPGACQAALGLTDDDVREHLERYGLNKKAYEATAAVHLQYAYSVLPFFVSSSKGLVKLHRRLRAYRHEKVFFYCSEGREGGACARLCADDGGGVVWQDSMPPPPVRYFWRLASKPRPSPRGPTDVATPCSSLRGVQGTCQPVASLLPEAAGHAPPSGVGLDRAMMLAPSPPIDLSLVFRHLCTSSPFLLSASLHRFSSLRYIPRSPKREAATSAGTSTTSSTAARRASCGSRWGGCRPGRTRPPS